MTKISLIRHGLVHNPAEVYYGRLPGYGLAALGRAQAAAAGDYLAGAGIVAVYHSPMLACSGSSILPGKDIPATMSSASATPIPSPLPFSGRAIFPCPRANASG